MSVNPDERDGRGVLTKIIERNTTIPVRRSEVFTTAEDNQPSLLLIDHGQVVARPALIPLRR